MNNNLLGSCFTEEQQRAIIEYVHSVFLQSVAEKQANPDILRKRLQTIANEPIMSLKDSALRMIATIAEFYKDEQNIYQILQALYKQSL